MPSPLLISQGQVQVDNQTWPREDHSKSSWSLERPTFPAHVASQSRGHGAMEVKLELTSNHSSSHMRVRQRSRVYVAVRRIEMVAVGCATDRPTVAEPDNIDEYNPGFQRDRDWLCIWD